MTWLGGGCSVAAAAVRQKLPPAAHMIDAGYVASEVHGTVVVDAERNLALPLARTACSSSSSRWTTGMRGNATRCCCTSSARRRDYHIIVTTLRRPRALSHERRRARHRQGWRDADPRLRAQGPRRHQHHRREARRGSGQSRGRGAARAGGPAHAVLCPCRRCRCGRLHRLYRDRTASTGRHSRSSPARSTRRCASSNIEYDSKRGSGRLKPLRLVALADGAERAYRRHCVGKGQREAQFKVLTLQNADEFDFDVTPHLISERADEAAPR